MRFRNKADLKRLTNKELINYQTNFDSNTSRFDSISESAYFLKSLIKHFSLIFFETRKTNQTFSFCND
tara:strand:- start:297 stop:500 length:204 start_codon:yes stop_codon:yes gene_type:complete